MIILPADRSVIPRTNLLINPAFNVSTAYWDTNAARTILSQDSSAGPSGGSAAIIEQKDSPGDQYISGPNTRIGCKPGDVVHLSLMLNPIGRATVMKLFILEYNSSDVRVALPSVLTDTLPIGEWSTVACEFPPIVATAVSFFFQLTTNDSVYGDVSRFANIIATRNTPALPYFDGNSDNAKWTGSSNASSSITNGLAGHY